MREIDLTNKEYCALEDRLSPLERFVNEDLILRGYRNFEILDDKNKPIIRFLNDTDNLNL